jgi:thioesterase domain-containing protein
VDLLTLFDSGAPTPIADRTNIATLTQDDLIWRMLQQAGAGTWTEEAFGALPYERRLAELMNTAKAVGKASPDIRVADIERLVALFSHSLEALSHYAPQRYDGRVVVLHAQDEARVSISDTLGWEQYCADVVSVPVGGTHQTMLNPQHVPLLAKQLRPYL